MGQRRRRWPDIVPTLILHFVFRVSVWSSQRWHGPALSQCFVDVWWRWPYSGHAVETDTCYYLDGGTYMGLLWGQVGLSTGVFRRQGRGGIIHIADMHCVDWVLTEPQTQCSLWITNINWLHYKIIRLFDRDNSVPPFINYIDFPHFDQALVVLPCTDAFQSNASADCSIAIIAYKFKSWILIICVLKVWLVGVLVCSVGYLVLFGPGWHDGGTRPSNLSRIISKS